MRCCFITLSAIALVAFALASVASAAELEPGVRGLATRSPAGMKIDGDLAEFKDAFATPVEYFNADAANRPAQFLYMWDDEAFYAGLRTLDTKQANHAPDDRLWEGDAVEWYFDTRRGERFRDIDWGKGAVHCYWTAYKGAELKPRFCLRPGYLDAIPKLGVEVAARRTSHGAELEFKLPWKNFEGFAPQAGTAIALDAELCYSDGGPRVFRTFTYGNPLCVQQPAGQGKVQLVDRIEPQHWKQVGQVMMPMRVDLPWAQKTKAHAEGRIALPVNHAYAVGKTAFRILDLDGKTVDEFEAKPRVIQAEGNFAEAVANWPIDMSPPGASLVIAVVYDKAGKEITRVAPRLTSVNMTPGY